MGYFRRIGLALIAITIMCGMGMASPTRVWAASGYDGWLRSTPNLSVYTDWPTNSKTMDISSTWWNDFKQSHYRRLAVDPSWDASNNIVPVFEDIRASGGSWFVVSEESSYGKVIQFFGTHDPNATCDFTGPSESDIFICRAGPGYDSVKVEYFTHNSFGSNGCGYINTCSDNGMNIYHRPEYAPSDGYWSWFNNGLPNLRFYVMHIKVNYPDGYAGERLPTDEPGSEFTVSRISPTRGVPDTLFDVGWPCAQATPGDVTILDSTGRRFGKEDGLMMSALDEPGLFARHKRFWVPSEGDYVAVPSCGGAEVGRLAFSVKVEAAHAALGDSFSSGEGATEFLEGTGTANDIAAHDAATPQCHRSASAWGNQVGSRMGLSTRLNACSGAEIPDFYAPNAHNVGEVPQLSNISATATKLVTLTAGGNDVGFGEMLARCVRGPFNLEAEFDCRDFKFDGSTQKYSEVVSQRIRDLGRDVSEDNKVPPLHDVYLAAAERIARGGTIVVAGYPRFFGTLMNDKIVDPYKAGATKETFKVCTVGGSVASVDGYYLLPKDAAWLNSVAGELNARIQSEVGVAASNLASIGRSDVRIVFADVDAGFAGHRLCDKGSAWFNGIKVDLGQGGVLQVSMHPNLEGQGAYATSVLNSLGVR